MTPAEARGDSRLCTSLRREAVTWELWNNDHPDEAAVTTPPLLRQAADALDALARQLAEAKESLAIVRKLAAEDSMAEQRKRVQAEAQLAQATARLAAGEGLLRRIRYDRSWRTNDNTLWPDICAFTKATDAALQPKEL